MEPCSTHVNMGSSPSVSCSRVCPTSWRWVEESPYNLFPVSTTVLIFTSTGRTDSVVLLLFCNSCITRQVMKMETLAAPPVVTVKGGWGWPGFISSPAMSVPCSTPTTTTRSSWLSSRGLITNLQAASLNHVLMDMPALMSYSVLFHRWE